MAEIVALIIAYLIGSISSGVIYSKLTGKIDPRTAGSGSAGATNVLRLLGKHQALTVLIIDMLKGIVAIIIAHSAGVTPFGLGLVALAVVAGHIFPVFFKFKGGKGVATMLGCLLAMHLAAGILAIIVWIAVAYITKYSSLASICSLAAGAIFTLMYVKFGAFIPVLLAVALILWKHKDNIMRLKNNEESKIDFSQFTDSKTSDAPSVAPTQPSQPATPSEPVKPEVATPPPAAEHNEPAQSEVPATPTPPPEPAPEHHEAPKPTITDPSLEDEPHKPSITDPTAEDKPKHGEDK